MKEEKKSILNEALADFNEIMQAADVNAKKRLAEEFSDKFNTFLNEELKKKNNKKESYKKIDENKESDELKSDEKIQSNNQNQMKEETKKEETHVVENSEVSNDAEVKNKDLQTENFDMRELDTDSVGTALENMENNDEVITMEEIENEINNLDNLSAEEPESHEETEMELLMKIKSDLDLIIGKLDNTEPELPTDDVEQDSLSDDDIDSVLNMQDEEPEVDEAKGLSYASRRNASGRNLPNNDYLSSMESDQSPYLQEAKVKISGLIKENKELTKGLNELKKHKKTTTDLLENYKNALTKYRSQLTEMAIFNTNLVNVNNLLVNEEFNLTHDDKVKIINEFKTINSISESQDKYGKLLSEMKENKSTISESFENKVSASIQPSSKQQLSEAIEKTAYSSNGLNRIKSLIEYAENRGKK